MAYPILDRRTSKSIKMADEKNYVGKGWKRHIDKYDSDLINLSLNRDALAQLPVNDYGDIKVTIVERKEVDEKSGATHYVIEDTYKGNEKTVKDQAPEVASADAPETEKSEDSDSGDPW